ncbi:MAG: hypothetical protein WAL63_00730 [Solirubrobacteraceae bacterium]
MALVVSVSPALAGCGGHAPPERAHVARYVAEVNRIESSLAPALSTVSRVSAEIASRTRTTLAGRGAAGQLATAQTQIRSQAHRLAALPAPAPAARLRSLLLQLTAAQAALTRQLALLIGFLPRFGSALDPLGPALMTLERALPVRKAAGGAAVSAVYAAKVRALRRFKDTVRGIVVRLDRLTPPAVSVPAYMAQLASLNGMERSAGRLAAALAGAAPRDVRPLLVNFDRAALLTRTRAAQAAEAAAVQAYDARAGRLMTLSEAITRERLRLAATVR